MAVFVPMCLQGGVSMRGEEFLEYEFSDELRVRS